MDPAFGTTRPLDQGTKVGAVFGRWTSLFRIFVPLVVFSSLFLGCSTTYYAAHYPPRKKNLCYPPEFMNSKKTLKAFEVLSPIITGNEINDLEKVSSTGNGGALNRPGILQRYFEVKDPKNAPCIQSSPRHIIVNLVAFSHPKPISSIFKDKVYPDPKKKVPATGEPYDEEKQFLGTRLLGAHLHIIANLFSFDSADDFLDKLRCH